MKKLLLILSLALTPAFTACQTPPSERAVAVQTLKAVGFTAKTAMDASTQLLKQGTITVEQWQKVAVLYDTRFQPAFNVAVLAVQSDLSPASPDLVAIAVELTNLVASFQKPKPITYLAPDGVNIITDYGDGHITSTLVLVSPKNTITADIKPELWSYLK
jgi:hypothetical protein